MVYIGAIQVSVARSYGVSLVASTDVISRAISQTSVATIKRGKASAICKLIGVCNISCASSNTVQLCKQSI